MRKTALATRAQVAAYLNVPTQTVHQWASDGTGPPYVKIGNRARYDWQDVHAWIATHPRGPRETASLTHT